jgi:predicted small lipoprotein YifL
MNVRTRLSAALFLLAASSLMLSACGNRGPLTLPPKDQPAQPAAATKSAPDNSKTESSGKP